MDVVTMKVLSPPGAADPSAHAERGETWRSVLAGALRHAVDDAVRRAARGAVRDAAQEVPTEHDVLIHAVRLLVAVASAGPRGGFADPSCGAATGPGWMPPHDAFAPHGSAAGRWAHFVLRGCSADHDPRTIADWAGVAHQSYSGLCESCRLVRVQPKDARDFTRLLRVALQAPRSVDGLGALLNVSDRRTRDSLLTRGGFGRDWPSTSPPTLDAYLTAQRFVPAGNCGLRAVAMLLGKPSDA